MTEEDSTPSEAADAPPTPQAVMASKIEAISALEVQLEAYRGRATRLNARINDLTLGTELHDAFDHDEGTREEQLAKLIGTYGVAVDRVMQTRIALYGAYEALFTPDEAPVMADGDIVTVAGPDGRMYQGTYRAEAQEVEIFDPDFPAHLFATGVTKDEAEVSRISTTTPLTLNSEQDTVSLTEAVEAAITPPDPTPETSPTSEPAPDVTPSAVAEPTAASLSTAPGDTAAAEVPA